MHSISHWKDTSHTSSRDFIRTYHGSKNLRALKHSLAPGGPGGLGPGPKPLCGSILLLKLMKQQKHKQMHMKSLSLSARNYIFRPQLAKRNQESRTRAPRGEEHLTKTRPPEENNQKFCCCFCVILFASKVAGRRYDLFRGGIAPRSLLCLRKQRIPFLPN